MSVWSTNDSMVNDNNDSDVTGWHFHQTFPLFIYLLWHSWKIAIMASKKNQITIKLIVLGYCSACPSKNGYYYYGPDVHIYYNVTIVIRGICKLSKTSPGSGCFLRTPINTIFKIVCKERKVQKCKLMKSGWIFFKLDIC